MSISTPENSGDKPHIREIIIVEGRYDKATLAQVVDADIFPVNGFSVFTNGEKRDMLRRLASSRGAVILTDSDSAGNVIRSRLKTLLAGLTVYHAYVPQLAGKEIRKAAPSKEGYLGVEGMSRQTILDALTHAGVFAQEAPQQQTDALTRYDLFALGLSGGAGSRAKREALCQALALPKNLSAADLLVCLNTMKMSVAAIEELLGGELPE
jgi:ribonuclease M5